MTILICRRWIGTVPFEYADRQRFAGGIGQQTDNNLQLAFFAIAVIAELAQFVALALQIATGDIVEKQAWWLRPAAALILMIKGSFDLFLARAKIVECSVEIVFVERI